MYTHIIWASELDQEESGLRQIPRLAELSLTSNRQVGASLVENPELGSVRSRSNQALSTMHCILGGPHIEFGTDSPLD